MSKLKEYEAILTKQAQDQIYKEIASDVYKRLYRRLARFTFKDDAIIEIAKLVIEEAEYWKEESDYKLR